MWEGMTRKKWHGFKELYEMVTDVWIYDESVFTKIIWSAWHSLRAGWWANHMIALVGGKMGKAAKSIYRFWWGQVHDIIRWRQVHDIIRWRQVHDIVTSYNQIYLVGPVKEIMSGKNITLQGLVSGMELFLYSTALWRGSLSEKALKKSTRAVMIRIAITFENQIFL